MHKQSNMKSGLIIALSVSAIAIIIVLFLTANRKTWQEVAKIHPVFILIAIILIFLKWASSCIRTNMLIKAAGASLPFGKVTKAVLGGGFVGSVTPFHAGGVPSEVYFLYKFGLPADISAAVVTAGATASIICFAALTPAIILIGARTLHAGFGWKTALTWAGIVAFFVLLIFIYAIMNPEKISLVLKEKAPEFMRKREGYMKAADSIANAALRFQTSLRTIVKSSIAVFVAVFFLTIFFWLAGLLVTPVILLGMGYPEFFWKAFLAQTLAAFLLPFAPVPGESGFAEFTFSGIFATFLPSYLVGITTLSWRFFTFYLTLLAMGVAFVLALNEIKRTEQGNIKVEQQNGLTEQSASET
ncbi:MAG: lysylphosphatidylglycerol synthase transmembrane domain-containing protein [Actinomycetota bacterium]|nr:lysylphosphatidylglycerol synthase transmembrane domain-containing protein [Actinomycetota bacterium]